MAGKDALRWWVYEGSSWCSDEDVESLHSSLSFSILLIWVINGLGESFERQGDVRPFEVLEVLLVGDDKRLESMLKRLCFSF
jgi:hypothetical protein